MFRFVDIAPTATPGEALAMGIAIVIGGTVLFGVMVWLARRLAKAGGSPGARPDPE